MAVARYEIRLNGGTFTDEIINAGLGMEVPDSGGVLSYLKTGLEADTEYTVEIRAVDHWGNVSDWSNPVIYTTPVISLPWTDYLQTGWVLNGDYSLEATGNDASPYAAEVVPQFTNVGDYLEFESIAGDASFHIRLTDSLGNFIYTYSNSQIDNQAGFLQFAVAYADGDIIRLEKTGATQFTIKVNGAGATVISQALTGTVVAQCESQTVIGNKFAPPLTNIAY